MTYTLSVIATAADAIVMSAPCQPAGTYVGSQRAIKARICEAKM